MPHLTQSPVVKCNFMSNVINIPFNKTFTLLALIVLTGLFMFLAYALLNVPRPYEIVQGLVVLLSLNVFCLFLVIYFIKKYCIPTMNGQPAVSLNSQGIIDNIRNNTIEWDNVKGIRFVTNRGTNFIAIDLIDNKAATSQTRNIFKKLLFLSNKFFYGTPILIATQFLNGDGKNIFDIIEDYFTKTQNST